MKDFEKAFWGLRKERLRKGLTQKELSEKAGVTERTISGLENGEYNPTVDTLRKLAKVLEVDVKQLF